MVGKEIFKTAHARAAELAWRNEHPGKTSHVKSEYAEEMHKLAKNTGSKETLAKLSSSEEWFVRRAVAGNANAPEETLLRLLDDSNFSVRIQARKTLKAQAIDTLTPEIRD